jgi:large subunit ribosomal protein L4
MKSASAPRSIEACHCGCARSAFSSEPKTKLLIEQLAGYPLERALIVADEVDRNLYLASRNIPHVEVRDVAGVDPVSLVGCEKVLVTVAALRKFEEMLG